MPNMEALLTCKAALDSGLITEDDYNSVKQAWLRSQSLKSAFEAGLMGDSDYEQVKRDFLSTLGCALSSPSQSTPPPAAATANGHHHAAKARVSAPPVAASPPRAAPKPRHTSSEPSRHAPGPVPAAAPPSRSTSRSGAAPSSGRTSSSQFYTGKDLPGRSMSGYTIDEGSVAAFNTMRAKSAFPWILWRIEGSQVVVDTLGEGDYQNFLDALPPSECRYAAYDYFLETSEGRPLNKLVFVLWTPSSASVKNKMMYSSTKDFFKGQLDGLSCDMQGDDMSDITQDEMHSTVVSNLTRK